MPTHIIHKQIFNLSVDAEDQAHSIGESLKRSYYDHVLDALNHVFSRLAPDDMVYRFNRIELNLGHLDAENLEIALQKKMPALVEEALRNKINRADIEPDEEDGMQKIPRTATIFDAFIHYLKNGVLPWWFIMESPTSAADLFSNIPNIFSDSDIADLNKVLDSPRVRARLALQFSEPFIIRLLQAVPPDEKELNSKNRKKRKTLKSIITQELREALEKTSISQSLRRIIIVEIMIHLASVQSANRYFSISFQDDRLPDMVDRIISETLRILLKVLAKNNYKAHEIKRVLKSIHENIPEETIIGLWYKQHKYDIPKISKIIRTELKPKNKDASDFDKDHIEESLPFDLDETGIYIRNAGLVLLWPFFKSYFSSLGLLANDRFKSDEERQKASCFLQFVATGEDDIAEHEIPLNKILCGLPVDEPIRTDFEISLRDKKESEILIQSIIEKWAAIGKVSVEGFRESFLKREGRLNRTENGWSLKVERKTWDLLLDKLPWMIGMIKTGWMKQMIHVDW